MSPLTLIFVRFSSFFKHFYGLTGPKYAEKYEDSESGIKSIHFLAKMIKQHDFISTFWSFFGNFVGQLFLGIGGGL